MLTRGIALTSRQGQQAGLTLVELIMTIVIMGLAMLGIAAMLSRGVSESADTLLEAQAIALGQAYLDEIMGRRFDERSPCYDTGCTAENAFGPDGGESSRDRYDDVDDFHGLAEGAAYGTPLRDAEGNPRSGYESFSVTVTVRYAGDDAVIGRDPTDAKLITVNVRFAGQSQGWDFSAYKGNY